MKKFVRVLSLFILIFVFGFSTPTKAEDISEAEVLIKQTFLDCEKAWNKKDAKGVIAFYHDDANIMTGNDRRMVSKKEYEKILPQRWKFGKVKFGVPETTVTVDKAKVKVKAAFEQLNVKFIFYMVLQDNRWLIMLQEY